ncbi:MAG: DHH family phosphoesterase [Thermoflexaceae bacterium]|nr:DHH family phosphoesterase [Thermoflexaceae bacterium]
MGFTKKPDFKLSGQLKSYLTWPVYIGMLFLVMTIPMYVISIKAGLLMTVFDVIYFVIAMLLFMYKHNDIMASMIDFAANYSQVQKGLLKELSVPYGLIDDNGRIIWINYRMKEILGKEKEQKKSIMAIFESIRKENLPDEEEIKEIYLSFNERDYRIELKRVSLEDISGGLDLLDEENSSGIIAMYMFDTTELNDMARTLAEQQMVSALIYIDNYDEIVDSSDEGNLVVTPGLVESKINKYICSRGGIVKKLEKDKYIALFTYKALDSMKSDKFSLLGDIKKVEVGEDKAFTISIGIGTKTNDEYLKSFELAKSAMDLALGRGGDQVVVKDNDKVIYFGGKSQQMEKNTRVKARIKAHALREILNNKEKVFIMGHKLGDMDSLGASVGIFRAVTHLGKKAYIVINDITTSVKPVMDRLMTLQEYEGVFINGSTAEGMVDSSSVVVTVDVNKPSYTECENLLNLCRTLVVIDHHRQSDETIEGAILSYVEPNASSASEMVAELLQYIDNGVKLKAAEAEAMYAGVIIDTNNFNNKAGVRTFEASAFLRRNGADIVRVRKFLRSDMEEYKAKAATISNMEVYKGCFAFAVSPSEGLASPTIVAAQAANEMLDINGIKASFVFTDYAGKIYISARSIDEVNVQVIMEKLGGGGHMSISGAQLKDTTVEEAVEIVKKTLDTMIEEGDL